MPVRALALLLAVLFLLGVAGCGGDDSLAPQTPGEPATVPIPEASEPPGGGGNDNESTDEGTDSGSQSDEATPTPTPTAAPDDTGAAAPPETAATPEDTGGGATAPDEQADSPTNDTPPPAGSDAQQFEDFCAQNPGAC